MDRLDQLRAKYGKLAVIFLMTWPVTLACLLGFAWVVSGGFGTDAHRALVKQWDWLFATISFVTCVMTVIGFPFALRNYLAFKRARAAGYVGAAATPMPEARAITLPSRLNGGWEAYKRLVGKFHAYHGILGVLAMLGISLPFVLLGSFASRAPLAGVAFILLVVLLFLIILLIGALGLRDRSMRILLLRPFGERRMTKALKRVVTGYLGPRAVVYTLSDRNYRPNPFLKLWDIFGDIVKLVIYLLSPIRRPSLRIATVTSELSFFRFTATLTKAFRPSWRSLLSGGQAFNIRTSDEWWQRCIDLLMHSTDLIVMDISKVSAGSAWEIEQMGRRGLLDRCVFIVQESHAANALEGIAALLPAGFKPRLHVFGEDGKFADAAAFEGALQQPFARSQPETLTATTGAKPAPV